MSEASSYFAADYAEARRKFLDAAKAAGATVTSYDHPLKGPAGEDLAMDVARLGAGDATKALVASSGTHGVEGFCGSGAQVGFLRSGWSRDLPADTALVLVHAHNPHGFANLRRVNEDNIDINRNFIDFSQPVPANPAYDEVHPMLVPADWNGPAHAAADQAIEAFVAERGMFAYQAAVSGGQYGHADGLFYGGAGPCWSRRTIEAMAQEHLAGFAHLAMLDFHTGLGPRGFGEIIATGKPGSEMNQRTHAWYGDQAKSPEGGDSVSAVVQGTVDQGYANVLPDTVCTCIAIEYGTLPPREVLGALRADNWLYLHGQVDSDVGREIKQQIRDAFYGDDDQWKADVWARAQDVAAMALNGLKAS
jgi:hypothetical protein